MPAPVPVREGEVMTCEAYLARHSEFLDGELSEQAAGAMHTHMAACESCARYDRVLRRGLSLLREQPPIRSEYDPYHALQERLAGPAEPRRRAMAITAIAAAVLGVLAWSVLSRADVAGRIQAPQTAERLAPDRGPLADPDAIGVRPGDVTVLGSAWLRVPDAGSLSHVRTVTAERPLPFERGPYTPVVLLPPDYGQGVFATTALSPYSH